jgi:hypothetical protein
MVVVEDHTDQHDCRNRPDDEDACDMVAVVVHIRTVPVVVDQKDVATSGLTLVLLACESFQEAVAEEDQVQATWDR